MIESQPPARQGAVSSASTGSQRPPDPVFQSFYPLKPFRIESLLFPFNPFGLLRLFWIEKHRRPRPRGTPPRAGSPKGWRKTKGRKKHYFGFSGERGVEPQRRQGAVSSASTGSQRPRDLPTSILLPSPGPEDIKKVLGAADFPSGAQSLKDLS